VEGIGRAHFFLQRIFSGIFVWFWKNFKKKLWNGKILKGFSGKYFSENFSRAENFFREFFLTGSLDSVIPLDLGYLHPILLLPGCTPETVDPPSCYVGENTCLERRGGDRV